MKITQSVVLEYHDYLKKIITKNNWDSDSKLLGSTRVFEYTDKNSNGLRK